MKADLTRITFEPSKHFSRVIMQQGRVQLDADWNEQAAILSHYLQALTADVIGPQGGPEADLGFGIKAYPSAPLSPVSNDFQVAAFALNGVRQQGLGTYYIDGIRCEVDSTPVTVKVQSVSSTPPGTATVQADQWTLDGTPFQLNQFVELFDDVQLPNIRPQFSPRAVQITGVQIADAQRPGLTLTLQGVPSNLNSASAPKLRRLITYLSQPDYPVPDGEKLNATTGPTYLVYLDLWERHITYFEDDSIREVALGGPDTATRAKVVWQVKAVPGTLPSGSEGRDQCDEFKPSDPNFWAGLFGANRGRLKAKAKKNDASMDPRIVPPDARYRGVENHLYRVEIHRRGSPWDGKDGTKISAATFKWSRENGAVVFPIAKLFSGSSTTTVILKNLGRDDRFGLAEGDWVEIHDDDYVLQNRAANLLQVQSIDRTGLTVILKDVPGSSVGQDASRHPLLRRWDQQAGAPAEGGLTVGSDSAALVQEGVWLELENGVQIQFQTLSDQNGSPLSQYRTSDYWLIPARTAIGDLEWPTEADLQGNPVPIAKPPDGVTHHYAPLGVITLAARGSVTLAADCRKSFPFYAK